MKSKLVLFIHTSLFLSFAASALVSPLVGWYYPEFFSNKNIIIIAIFVIATMGSWKLFGGCPFTVWENRFRNREKPGSAYNGACIDHYAREWLGIVLPTEFSTRMLKIFFLIPIATGVIVRLFYDL